MIATAYNDYEKTRIVCQYETGKIDTSEALRVSIEDAKRWNSEETRPNMIVRVVEVDGKTRNIIDQKQPQPNLFEVT
jgi:hypothetical protein